MSNPEYFPLDTAASGDENVSGKFGKTVKRLFSLRRNVEGSELPKSLLSRASSIYSVYPMTAGGEMPDKETIDNEHLQMMVEKMGECVHNMPEILNMSTQNKWVMLCNNGRIITKGRDPQYYVRKISTGSSNETFLKSEFITSLRVQMTNQPISWIKKFVECGGTGALCHALTEIYNANEGKKYKDQVSEWMLTIRAFTNNSIGLEEASNSQDFLNAICLFTLEEEVRHRLVSVNILTVLAYMKPPLVVTRILAAMTMLQQKIEDENRFDSFVKMMAKECRLISKKMENPGMHLMMLVDGLMFMNSILDNIDDSEMRIHVRNQLFRHPFRGEIEGLNKTLKDARIARQLEVFNSFYEMDSESVMSHYSKPAKTFSSPLELHQMVMETLDNGSDPVIFQSLLQHLVTIQCPSQILGRYIKLLDKTLEQILFTEKGLEPNFCASPVPYMTTKELERILNTNEVDALKQENMRLKFEITSLNEQRKNLSLDFNSTTMATQKQILEYKDQLDTSRKEAEDRVTAITKECDEAKEKIRLEMEKSTSKAIELEKVKQDLDKTRNKIADLEKNIKELEKRPLQAPNPDTLVTSPKTEEITISIDNNNVENKAETTIESPLPETPRKASVSGPPKGPPGPPPPMKIPGTPVKATTLDFNFPKPSKALKPLFWKKVFQHDVPGSIWKGVDVSQFYGKVDYAVIDRLFEANFKTEVKHAVVKKENPADFIRTFLNGQGIGLAIVMSPIKEDENVLCQSLEEQNFDIFKPELCSTLLKIFESLSPERHLALLEYNGNVEGLVDKSDRLISKLGLVRAFPLKLKLLSERCKLESTVQSIKDELDLFFTWFEKIKNSERLRKLLWFVLFVGNYVNQGSPRGGAFGFPVSFIANLKAIKSCEPNMDMLMFIIGIVTSEFPDILEIVDELAFVFTAKSAKIQDIEDRIANNLKCDLAAFKIGFWDGYKDFIVTPTDFGPFDDPSDRYYCQYNAILEYQRKSKALLEDRIKELKDQFVIIIKYLSEGKDITPESIFTMLADFIEDFTASQAGLERRAEVEKAEKIRAQNPPRVGRSRVAMMLKTDGDKRGVVDNILDSLRSPNCISHAIPSIVESTPAPIEILNLENA